jgi:phosphoribosyl transferase-like protein
MNLTIYYCGRYEGRGRRENPSPETRLLLASKYHNNLEARRKITERMVLEVAHLAGVGPYGSPYVRAWQVCTYALARDSGIEHARALALLIAPALHLEVHAPCNFDKHDLRGRRVLLIDDVCTTGRTLNDLALDVLEHGAAGVDALVYLKTHDSKGLPISRPRL